MTDVLSKLQVLSFRGIKVPILGECTAHFAHEDATHKFIYRDGAMVEAEGAQNWTFSYTIPFRQDIAKGPYKNLYTEVYPAFIIACRDRTPGDLVDPDLGLFRAKATDFTRTLDPQKRDGADVRVEFVHAPTIEDIETDMQLIPPLSGIKTQAGELDRAVATMDWEQEEPPEPTVDPLSALDGLGQQLLFIGDRINAKLADTATRLENLEQTIDKLENPNLWPLRRSARRIREASTALAARGQDPGRRVLSVVNKYNRGLSSIAAEAGMTVQEMIELNPALAALPEVPANTVFRRYG